MRVFKTPYIEDWESRPDDIKSLTEKGVIPAYHDLDNDDEDGTKERQIGQRFLLGKCASVINDIKPAKEIVDDMVNEAVATLKNGSQMLVGGGARL